jgi:hypothetical protein
LRFMQERTAETKIQPKINSTLKELGLWMVLEQKQVAIKILGLSLLTKIFIQCPHEHDAVVS